MNFTREQLEMFATLATAKAEREAALCYGVDDPRRERAAQELMVIYYRQYATPPYGVTPPIPRALTPDEEGG